MAVIDSFPFYNEFPLLEARIAELDSVVDLFVAVESNYTHAGNPKPYLLGDIYQDYPSQKLVVLQFDATPYKHNAWLHENAQREALGVFYDTLADNDIIMLSDCDEIPRREAVEQYLKEHRTGVWALEQRLHYLFMNTYAGQWNGTKIFSQKYYAGLSTTKRAVLTNEVRYIPQASGVIKDGGWHFSSCGGFEKVRNKFNNYAHTEMQLKTDEEIHAAMKELHDPFNKQKLEIVELETLPQYIQDNAETLYKDYLYDINRAVVQRNTTA